jgi:hypothetical protein
MYHVKLFYVQDIQVVYIVLHKPNNDFVYAAEEHTSSQAFDLVPHHNVVQVRQEEENFHGLANIVVVPILVRRYSLFTAMRSNSLRVFPFYSYT